MRRFNVILTFLALLLAPRLAGAQQPTYRPFVPPNGFVPDSATAVRIAVAVWAPIYGDVHFMSQQPLTATLSDGVWTVTGTVSAANLLSTGGFQTILGAVKDSPYTVVVRIDSRDGRILYQGRT
jgi:NTF2 fold immunity protein of polymorphic toxin system component